MAIVRIRKNKTIKFKWPILTNGVATNLAGRDILVQVQGPTFSKFLPFTIEDGNVIITTLQGTLVTEVGKYRLLLWENYGKNGQTVVDIEAVQIVERTDLETIQ